MSLSRRSFLLAASGLVAGCGAGDDGLPELKLATGPAGGPYELLGARLAGELRRGGFRVRALGTAASVENLRMLAEGRADLGFSLADSADDGVRVHRQPIAALARMYMNYVHLVVLTGSDIRLPAQLAGRSVSIGASGSGTAVTARRVLDAAALARPARVSKFGLDTSLTALGEGRIEAFFWSGGVPTPALAASKVPIRLLALDSLVPALRRTYGPLYESTAVPAGEYGGPAPVPTIGTPSYLVCRNGLPEEVAFAVTEVLFQSRDRLEMPDAPGGRLDKRYAIGTGVVPLHPGAARYYRSVYG
ncbi:TAXI family TRAP transporter solute-binding subunit [Nonomuraea sp. NPDC046570]|uniref:TAXI family TRAP transporter solute-binding subunit n=1 Tax=Nonomuraea sp. NPDC046570 TaxID=3155255 RepID=UPI0033F4D30B